MIHVFSSQSLHQYYMQGLHVEVAKDRRVETLLSLYGASMHAELCYDAQFVKVCSLNIPAFPQENIKRKWTDPILICKPCLVHESYRNWYKIQKD